MHVNSFWEETLPGTGKDQHLVLSLEKFLRYTQTTIRPFTERNVIVEHKCDLHGWEIKRLYSV